jgi:hypothetical protein
MKLRPRRLGACMAALVAVCVFAPTNVTPARAASAISCAGGVSLDIGNSLTSPSTPVAGTWTASGECAVADTSNSPLLTVTGQPAASLTYNYQGTCFLGTMNFANNDWTGVFVAGLFAIERQASGRFAEWVGAVVPSNATQVCKGTPGTSMVWTGKAEGNGIPFV